MRDREFYFRNSNCGLSRGGFFIVYLDENNKNTAFPKYTSKKEHYGQSKNSYFVCKIQSDFVKKYFRSLFADQSVLIPETDFN